MRSVVVGGKYALYGIIPAIIQEFGGEVLVESRHRDFWESRRELSIYSDQVTFENAIDSYISISDLTVISVPPIVQARLIHQLAPCMADKTVLLDKPLAESPNSARLAVSALTAHNISWGLNFTLTEAVRSHLGSFDLSTVQDLRISWAVPRPPVSSWKCEAAEGGGIVRFFAIHIFGLLATLGNWVPFAIRQGPNEIFAQFQNTVGNICTVNIAFVDPDDANWMLSCDGRIRLSGHNPFDLHSGSTGGLGVPDVRISAQRKVLRSLVTRRDAPDIAERSIDIWCDLEQMTGRHLPRLWNAE